MAAWISVTGQMGLSYPGSIDSVKCTAIGTVVRFRNETLGEGEFIYLTGAANVDAGDVCSYEIAYNASVATSVVAPWVGTENTPSPLCVATAATVAATWGWYQVSGSAAVNSSGSIADGDDLFWQAAGVVSATLVAGKQMLNAVAASANGVPSTDKVIVTIDRPLAQGVDTPAFLFNNDYVQSYRAVGMDPDAANNSTALSAAWATGQLVDGQGRTFAMTSIISRTLGNFAIPRSVGLRNARIDCSGIASSSILLKLTGVGYTNSIGTTGVVAIGVGTSYTQSAPVSSTTGYTAGAVVLVQSTDLFTALDTAVRSEWNVVDSIVANTTINFRYPLRTQYTTAVNLKVLNTSARPIFENVEIIGNPSFSQTGLDLYFHARPTWDRLVVENAWLKALGVNQCFQFQGGDMTVNNSNLSGFGYGFGYGGSTGTLDAIQATNARHVVTGGDYSNIISRDVTVGTIIGNGGIDAVADVHPGASDITYTSVSGYVGTGGTGDGVIIQAPNVTIGSIRLSGTVRNGLFIQFEGGKDTNRPNVYTIGQCNIVGAGQNSLSITNASVDAAIPIDYAYVAGGYFSGVRGVYVSATSGPIGDVVIGPSKSTVTAADNTAGHGPYYFEQTGAYTFGSATLVRPIAVGVAASNYGFYANCGVLAAPLRVNLQDPDAYNCAYSLRNIGAQMVVNGQEYFTGASTGRLLSSVVVTAGGTGYATNDKITIAGGTSTVAAVLNVTSQAAGVITAATVFTAGTYTVLPANPVAQASTTGIGTGATFKVQWTAGAPTSTWAAV